MHENVKAGMQSDGWESVGTQLKQSQPVVNQIDMLEKNLCRMQDVLQTLESRLSLVTRPLVSESCKQPPDITNASPMTQRLTSLNMMLERQIVQATMLRDSLEV